MHPGLTRLLRRTLTALITVTALSAALAASLAVHPFDSDDPLLGVAVADEVAAAFDGVALVLGPEIAPNLIPPVMVDGGFVSLGRVVEARTMTGPAGADLIKSGSGVDVAVTGRVLQLDEGMVLQLELAFEGGTDRVTVRADRGDRERLVKQAVRVVALRLPDAQGVRAPATPKLDGAYLEYVRAVALAGAGLIEEAADAVNSQPQEMLPSRSLELVSDLNAVIDGTQDQRAQSGRAVARRAYFGLSLATIDEERAGAAFAEMSNVTGLPVAAVWRGVLAANVNDRATALSALTEAATAPKYPYAQAVLASFYYSRGELDLAFQLIDELIDRGQSAGSAALLGASLVAYMADNVEREVRALLLLTRSAPFLTYPLQELSFRAFDRDDALLAAEVLTVAVELDPESDLYWTNLGWANYLLGFLEESEAASLRALELDDGQYIAAFNVGLVRAVTGRLAEALQAYDHALRYDPTVEPAAIEDLENALHLYPGVSAVSYALGYLYDAHGDRRKALTAYRRFLRLAGDSVEMQPFVASASAKVAELSAPPPPIEISGAVQLRLGQRGMELNTFHPGDPVYPVFELSTPGDALPTRVIVTLELLEPDTTEPVSSLVVEVTPPPGAVGYVIDDVELELPVSLAAGSYRLKLLVEDPAGANASSEVKLTVEGVAEPLRQLFGRGVVMTSLELGTPLYGKADLSIPERAVNTMLAELHSAAPAAEEALPVVEVGRFAGLGGAELFAHSDADDVRDFLAYLAASGARDSRFVFVDGYAQWALDGAPTGE